MLCYGEEYGQQPSSPVRVTARQGVYLPSDLSTLLS